ncbi:MAG: hypothetical protein D6730_00335 [Bacteroidetes bacterium]|nr:MAG: hypothetical protein D6730_00335 [Bacteroidota bacterium]
MFIPSHLPPNHKRSAQKGASVRLKTAHLLIGHELAGQVFGRAQNVYVGFDAASSMLGLAPVSNLAFQKKYNASQQMLKARNLQGDVAIALHDVLIDHDLNPAERELTFELREEEGALWVNLQS